MSQAETMVPRTAACNSNFHSLAFEEEVADIGVVALEEIDIVAALVVAALAAD